MWLRKTRKGRDLSFLHLCQTHCGLIVIQKKGLANILGQRWRNGFQKKLQVEISTIQLVKGSDLSLFSYFLSLFFFLVMASHQFLFSCSQIPKNVLCICFFSTSSGSKKSEDFPRKASYILFQCQQFLTFLTVQLEIQYSHSSFLDFNLLG